MTERWWNNVGVLKTPNCEPKKKSVCCTCAQEQDSSKYCHYYSNEIIQWKKVQHIAVHLWIKIWCASERGNTNYVEVSPSSHKSTGIAACCWCYYDSALTMLMLTMTTMMMMIIITIPKPKCRRSWDGTMWPLLLIKYVFCVWLVISMCISYCQWVLLTPQMPTMPCTIAASECRTPSYT